MTAVAGAVRTRRRPSGTDGIGAYEAALHAQGFTHVAGADEAGRGALAGPLVAAAVVLPPGWVPRGLRDSKLLTALQRDRLYGEILAGALAVSVRRISPTKLDKVGLHKANLAALRQAIARLPVPLDYVLVDGFALRRLPAPSLRVVKGDVVCASVAAASVIAKVTRDRTMIRFARRYPGYGFEDNKGYCAPDHFAGLDAHGATPIHRRCFARVRMLQADRDAADEAT